MAFIAAIHLITASKDVGSAVLGASMLIFDEKEEFTYSYLAQGWEQWDSEDVLAQFKKESLQSLCHTAEVIAPDLFASRIASRQAFHDTIATIWQNDYESRLSNRAYLYAVTQDKTKMYPKGFNFDGETLSAANRFVDESTKWRPTTTDNPMRGPEFLKELFIMARKYLGHKIFNENQKTINASAAKVGVVLSDAPALPTAAPALPTAAPALPGGLPPLPDLPSINSLTAPALPGNLPPLPEL